VFGLPPARIGGRGVSDGASVANAETESDPGPNHDASQSTDSEADANRPHGILSLVNVLPLMLSFLA
jgi:hypothetical protein